MNTDYMDDYKNIDINEMDINDIFNILIYLKNPRAKCINIEFLDIKELFEFLLELITKLFKHFYSDELGKVNLSLLSIDDFNKINLYLSYIGFKADFTKLSATNDNLEFANNIKYTNILINNNTKLTDLSFSLKCNQYLYIIIFKQIN